MKKLSAALLSVIMILSVCVFTASADEEAFASVEALYFDRLPKIDGKVSVEEWGEPTVANIKYPDNAQTDIKDDDRKDVTFDIWFRYTYEGFYIALTTPDESPCNINTTSSAIWNGDCLQIRLDPAGCTVDQGLEPSATRDKNYSSSYQELAFAYNKTGGYCSAYCFKGIMSGDFLQVEGEGSYGATNDGAVTTYEIFIPWKEIVDETPEINDTFGIAAALLTATEGENSNKWQNWLEWGCGVINGRNDNICGTNRLTIANKSVFGGKIPAANVIKGDVDGSGELNNKDVVALFKYLSGVTVDNIVEDALDVNGDGEVDNKDVVALFKTVSSLIRV